MPAWVVGSVPYWPQGTDFKSAVESAITSAIPDDTNQGLSEIQKHNLSTETRQKLRSAFLTDSKSLADDFSRGLNHYSLVGKRHAKIETASVDRSGSNVTLSLGFWGGGYDNILDGYHQAVITKDLHYRTHTAE